MKRMTTDGSPLRRIAIGVTGLLLLVGLVRFTGESGTRAIAAGLAVYEADHGRFPRRGAGYQGEGSATFFAGAGELEAILKNLGLLARQSGPLLPPLLSSEQATSSFDVFVELELGPGSEPFVIDSFFDITYHVGGADGGGGGGGGGSWPIEILTMDLVGNHPTLGKVQLRKSPTLQSTGHYTLTPLGGGLTGYSVDSFFDVFVELSLDDGATWRQTDGPFRMNLTSVPEPAAVALVMVGVAGVLALVRRR
jgi:hypothetical protein